MTTAKDPLHEIFDRLVERQGEMMPWMMLLAGNAKTFYRVLRRMTDKHIAGPEPLTSDPAEKAIIAAAMQVAGMATTHMVEKAMSQEDTADTLLHYMEELFGQLRDNR